MYKANFMNATETDIFNIDNAKVIDYFIPLNFSELHVQSFNENSNPVLFDSK